MDGDVLNQTIVIDNGSGLIKAGFAGTNTPQCILPAYVGRPKHERCVGMGVDGDLFVGQKAVSQTRKPDHRCQTDMKGLLRLEYPMRHGIIHNWESMELLWSAVYQELKAPSNEHPVLLTEAPLNPRANREKMLEVFFDTFNAPAFFVCTQAILALYTSGRTSGIVLDVGDGLAHVVPVVQGFALTHSIKRADVAGRDITEFLATLLRRAGTVFHTTAELEIVREIKEQACYVVTKPSKEEFSRDGYVPLDKTSTRGSDATSSAAKHTYRLPDGTQISVSKFATCVDFRSKMGLERAAAPEILFNPSLIGLEFPGVHQLLSAAISRTDMDLRGELLSQIVLSGGSTLFSGFVDRLLAELRRSQPKESLIRVYASSDRGIATFAGGSILGSLSTFKQLWVTRSVRNRQRGQFESGL